MELESLKDLEETFKSLKLKLDEVNKDALRDKKWDIQMMDENRLSQVLKSNIKLKEKNQLLLTQIGYLRINIFSEYLERINLLQEKNQLDKAAELMNKHAEIASSFIATKNQASLIKQLKKILSSQRPEPIEYLNKWRIFYESWFKPKSNQQPIDVKKRVEEFQQLKMAFIELYTFSFSVDNFPPLRYRRLDHQPYSSSKDGSFDKRISS